MKPRIFTLLLVAIIYLSSCQKDGTLPAVKPVDLVQKPVLTHDTTGSGTTGGNQGATPPFQGVVTNTIKGGYLRLQMAKDAANTDGIIISFNSGASAAYVRNEDAATLQGFGQVSLSSLSSDNVALAINALPLPPTNCSIPLKVNTQTDGTYTLSITAINAVPSIFEIWLKDAYRKDSVDYRSNPTYVFDIFKADPNSYGSNRFSLVIRQNHALDIHLLNFSAKKTAGGALVNWTVENEYNYSSFSIERSTDNGKTFSLLTRFNSNNGGNYSFMDKNPATGTDQYRLVIEDLNGLITTSKILSLTY